MGWRYPCRSVAGVVLATLLAVGWAGVDVGLVQANSAEPSPRRLLEQGKFLEEQKQFPKAIAVYRQYLAARPENDEVRATARSTETFYPAIPLTMKAAWLLRGCCRGNSVTTRRDRSMNGCCSITRSILMR